MLCIHHHSTDPHFNLAAEEYFFKNFKENVFMLWRNDNAIIVGKHQNTLSEINLDYVKEKGIRVVRRLSGGGAVYHDLGNLNFTFIQQGESEKLVDFRKYTQPILDILQEFDVDAKFEGRNDLTIQGKKFSGNAEHVFKNRILHHGTLLFESKMDDLVAALKSNPLKFQDKAVKSIKSRVTNIRDHLKKDISIEDFTNQVMKHIMEMYDDSERYDMTENDIAAISKLVEDKYGTWEWNYGYSPRYNFQKFLKTAGGTLEFDLLVEDGIIRECKIFGDYFNKLDKTEIEKAIEGCRHEENALMNVLEGYNVNDYFHNVKKEDLIEGMF
ncbi:MAG: lipoate--protein ligase [Candidatus Kapaibacterium sp.]